MLKLFIAIVSITALQLGYASAADAPEIVGQPLLMPSLTDQFEETYALGSETRILVVSHDMDSSDLVKEAFIGQTTDSLKKAGIQYYADISGMPALISRFIAIPRLKELPYRIALGREEEQLAHIPVKEGAVTVITLLDGTVTSVDSVTEPGQLADILSD